MFEPRIVWPHVRDIPCRNQSQRRHRRVVGVAETSSDVAGADGQLFWRNLERQLAEHAGRWCQQQHHRQTDRNAGEQREGRARLQSFRRTRGGHHLRRRRLAGGERLGQRIAARQRSRRPRAPTPAAASDPARGIAGSRARRVDRYPESASTASSTGATRAGAAAPWMSRASNGGLPGEQLVEHQAERIEIALLRRLAPRQLLRRHVGRRAAARRRARPVDRHRRETEVHDADFAAGRRS